MDSKDENNGVEFKLRLPSTITIKEIATVIGAVVSIMAVWSMFSTRLTVVESELVTYSKQITELKNDIKDRLSQHQKDDDSVQTDLKDLSKRVERLEIKIEKIKH